MRKQEISFLDTTSMEPRTHLVTRIRSAAAFIEALLDPELDRQ